MSLFLVTWAVLRCAVQVFCSLSLNGDVSHVFLMIKLRLRVFRKQTAEAKCGCQHVIFQSIASKVQGVSLAHRARRWPRPPDLAAVVPVGRLHCQVALWSSAHGSSLEGRCMCQLHSRSEELRFISLCREHLQKLFAIPLHGIAEELCLFSPVYLFSRLFASVDSWIFILYVEL